MERIFYLLKQSLFIKLALVATLVIGGSNSVWAQKPLPYSYGFENNDLTAEGWTKFCETITISTENDGGGIYSSNSYPGYDNSKYTYRFYGNTVNQYLISPLLATSETGIDFSFFYNSFTSTQYRSFNVGYSISDNSISSFTWLEEDISYKEDGWIKFNESFPSGTRYIAIRHKAGSQYQPFFIDDIIVEASELYKNPKNLTVVSYSSSDATLSWIAGRDEGAWQIAYSAKENFNPDTEGVKIDVLDNPYTLTNLVEGVTYYAYVRSNYDGNYSEWCNKVDFKPCLTVIANDGTNSSLDVPFKGSSVSSLNKSQFIVPASQLASIQNRQIVSLTFYTSENSLASASWGNATFDIYLKETTNNLVTSSSTAAFDEDWGTKVCNAKALSLNNHIMTIILDMPFTYSSNNLMIGFSQKTVGTNSSSCSWLTKSATWGNTVYTGPNKTSALPKIAIESFSSSISATLGTNGYTTFACPRPLDLSALPEGLKAYKAAVEGDKVKFTEISQAVPANTGVLLAGEANGTYDIPFADSGIAPDDNEFLVNSVGGTFTADDGYTYYGLIKNTLTFGTFAPGTVAIPTNKAYLKVANTPTGEARVLTCSFFDETTTGIMETRTESIDRLTTTKVFNLAGQQIANPTKGLYIINGKKHIIK